MAILTGANFLAGLAAVLVGVGLLRLSYWFDALGAARKPPRRSALSLFSWLVGWLFVVAGTLTGLGFLLGPAVLLAVIFGAFLVRRSRQDVLLGVLAAAAQREVPLAVSVRAFSEEHRGTRRRKLLLLAERLEEGLPLPDALLRGQLSARALLMVRVGHENGSLADALLFARKAADLEPVGLRVVGRLAYLGGLTVAACLVSVFLLMKITPAFQRLLANFDLPLPPLTQAVIIVLPDVRKYWYIPAAGLCVLGALAVLWYFDKLSFSMPLLGRLTRRLHAATILENLAMVVRQEHPLAPALETIARRYPRWPIRSRMYRVVDAVLGGRSWLESMQAEGLIGQGDRAILEAAQRVGNLAWALQDLADSLQRRFTYRVTLATQTVFPLVVVGWGLLVGCLMLAYFQPVIDLISRGVFECHP